MDADACITTVYDVIEKSAKDGVDLQRPDGSFLRDEITHTTSQKRQCEPHRTG